MIELMTEIVAGLTLLGSIFAAYWASSAKKEARKANSAARCDDLQEQYARLHEAFLDLVDKVEALCGEIERIKEQLPS